MRCVISIMLSLLFIVPSVVNAQEADVEEVSEESINYQQLPEPVRQTFEESKYSSWERGEVEKVQSKNQGTLFEIEVVKDDKEVELYYNEEGALKSQNEE